MSKACYQYRNRCPCNTGIDIVALGPVCSLTKPPTNAAASPHAWQCLCIHCVTVKFSAFKLGGTGDSPCLPLSRLNLVALVMTTLALPATMVYGTECVVCTGTV